jgi:predicted flap endonuclease-1-like 5' DNA nuclease
MSSLSCCLWWFVAGLLAGWLLWQLFDKLFRRDGDAAGVRLQRDLDSAHSRFNGVQSEITSSKAALTAKNDELSKMQADFGRRNDEVTKLNSDVNNVRTTMSERDKEITRLKGELDSAQKNAQHQKDEADRRAASVSTLQAEINALKNRASSAETVAAAASLTAAAATGLATAAGFGFNPQKGGKDDLIIIEGIGPKINEILVSAGIDTFAKLAATPIERVQQLLDDAGPNYRLANPASWAKQSALCARADWAALRKYQDDLVAGVDPTKGNA